MRLQILQYLIAVSAVRLSNVWLFFGLALVGGYADAAGFLLANSFTGHATGTTRL